MFGSSALAETIRFHPDVGERQTYALDVAVEARSLGFTDLYRRNLSAYLDVEPASDTVDPALRLTPTHVFLDEDGTWTASEAEDQWSEELWQLQHAGYNMTVGTADGVERPSPPEVVSAAPALEVRAGMLAERLHDGLADPFAAPAFPIPLEAEAGWTETIPDLYGYKDVEVEVTKVLEDRVHVAFSGGTGPAPGDAEKAGTPDWTTRGERIAGLAVIDRETGWIARQVVTREGRTDIRGSAVPARITTVLAPLRDGQISYAPTDSSQDRPMDVGGATLSPDLRAASETKLLQTDRATFEPVGEVLYLNIPADIERPKQAGRLIFQDLRLEDAEGQTVELNVHLGPVYTRPEFGADSGMVSVAVVTPNTVGPVSFGNVARAEATVSWYPPRTYYMELQPDGTGRGSVSEHGLRADLRPGPEQGTYLLRYIGEPNDWVDWSVAGEQTVSALSFAYDRGPTWLTPSESQVRMFASQARSGQTILLEAATAPIVRFRVDRPEHRPAVTRDVVFAPKPQD